MPVQTACSACSAKIKVKDELIGKSVKCPKCGKVFKALAAEAAETTVKAGASTTTKVAPPKPVAKKPPPAAWDDGDEEEEDEKKPAWDKKSKKDDDDDEDEEDTKSKKPAKKGPPPKKRADDDDEDEDDEKPSDDAFEDLLAQTTLSDDTKKHIQSELGLREKGIWVGQPDPKILTVRAIPAAIAAFFFITIFSVVGGIAGGSQMRENQALAIGIMALVGILWILLALGLPVAILFFTRRKALGSAYVITNKRCITFLPGLFSAAVPTSYYPDLVQHMRRMSSWVFGGDAGDIVFRTVTTITTTHHSRGGTSTSVSTTYYGFLGIRNLDEIERRIRLALLTDDDDDDDDDDEDDRRRRRKKKAKQKKRRRDDDDDD